MHRYYTSQQNKNNKSIKWVVILGVCMLKKVVPRVEIFNNVLILEILRRFFSLIINIMGFINFWNKN